VARILGSTVPKKPKSLTLTVFLLKDQLEDTAEILKHSDILMQLPVLIGGKATGTLFVQPTDDRRPS
jgi:hypothetical protein